MGFVSVFKISGSLHAFGVPIAIFYARTTNGEQVKQKERFPASLQFGPYWLKMGVRARQDDAQVPEWQLSNRCRAIRRPESPNRTFAPP